MISALDVACRYGLHPIRKGKRHWITCPFHAETSPSLQFYEDGGWYCYGCHAGGRDGISFLMKLRGITFREALKAVGEQPKHVLKPNITAEELRQQRERRVEKKLRYLVTLANMYYQRMQYEAALGHEEEAAYCKLQYARALRTEQWLGTASVCEQLDYLRESENRNDLFYC